MQIPVNKNLDEYKDDFYKGLTLRQTVLSILTVIAGTGAFLLFHSVCGISQTVSLYLAFPAVLPFAASGFLKIHGMSLQEYFKRKRSVTEQPLYRYEPVLLEAGNNSDMAETAGKGRKKEKRPVLETQEEMAARMKWNDEETNAGL